MSGSKSGLNGRLYVLMYLLANLLQGEGGKNILLTEAQQIYSKVYKSKIYIMMKVCNEHTHVTTTKTQTQNITRTPETPLVALLVITPSPQINTIIDVYYHRRSLPICELYINGTKHSSTFCPSDSSTLTARSNFLLLLYSTPLYEYTTVYLLY